MNFSLSYPARFFNIAGFIFLKNSKLRFSVKCIDLLVLVLQKILITKIECEF